VTKHLNSSTKEISLNIHCVLQAYMKVQFEGVGICAVNMADDMQDYLRSLFVLT